jgi:hypothetical protein
MTTPLQANPIEQFQARFGAVPGSQDPETERQLWEQICADLLKERAKMHEQINTLREERDHFVRAILTLMTPDPDIQKLTKEQILSQVGQGPSWEHLFAEIEAYPEK